MLYTVSRDERGDRGGAHRDVFCDGSTFFTLAGRRVGASVVSRSRLLIATLLALAVHWMTRGTILPHALSWEAWGWLALSGVIGLALGDSLLFRAFVAIGPAKTMLIFALAPAMAALFSWIFIGEVLKWLEMVGMATTLVGIVWVVAAPEQHTSEGARNSYALGVLFAVGGTIGQAIGLVTAKIGLTTGHAIRSQCRPAHGRCNERLGAHRSARRNETRCRHVVE